MGEQLYTGGSRLLQTSRDMQVATGERPSPAYVHAGMCAQALTSA